ncbi:sulfite exporter TauE/SafE family protein [Haloarchaeobius litoreus]|uniref:Sulfite exporter TauE/SafE family protein n=1 Tax=Haloarchaeobius litoreus TaxID=755306 RepID=A0ABD6DPE9_9EURY|nr:sulfite exporter TauE/SafE family protein [Haloarchaeobius litoreus]
MATCTPANPLLGTEALGLPVLALVGLLGGAHCVGMCGPLVATYAARMDTGGRDGVLSVRTVRQQAVFNLGRTVSYTLLGGLFGLAGQLVFVSVRDVTLVATEVRATTGIVVGLVVAAVGVNYATGNGARTLPIPGVERVGSTVRDVLLPRVDEWVGDYRIAGLGAVHGFLPCPLLYPAYLYAFVQGSALGGAAALAALGLGTVPAVFLTGTVFEGLDVGGHQRLHSALGVAFVVLGYIPLQHGLAALGFALPAIPLPHFQPW